MWFLRLVKNLIIYLILSNIIFWVIGKSVNFSDSYDFETNALLIEGSTGYYVSVFLWVFAVVMAIIKTISDTKKANRKKRAKQELSKVEILEKRIEELEGNQSPEKENTERIEKVEKAVRRGFITSILMFFVKLVVPFNFGDDV